jgi:protein tyrosine/serine phosphatase
MPPPRSKGSLGYIEASFDEMNARYGTIENYFAEALGIDFAAN